MILSVEGGVFSDNNNTLNVLMAVTRAIYPMQALTVVVLVFIIALNTFMYLQLNQILVWNITITTCSPSQPVPYIQYILMLCNPIINASLYPSSMSTIPVSSAIQPPLPPGPPPSIHQHHHHHHQHHQPMKSSSCPTPQYKYKPLFFKKSLYLSWLYLCIMMISITMMSIMMVTISIEMLTIMIRPIEIMPMTSE